MGPPRSKYKILHILDHSLPIHSGYSFRTQSIFQAQAKRGWCPVGLTTSRHELTQRSGGRKKDTVEGFEFFRTLERFHHAPGLLRDMQMVSSLAKRIREVAETEKPDILHAHSSVLNGIPAMWVGSQMGIPVVYEIRAFWEDAAVDHGTYGPMSWKYQTVKTLETFMCRKAGRVVILSEGLKGDLIRRGISPEKLRVIGNGIDVDNFTCKGPDEEFRRSWNLHGKKVIGFIGSFYRYEGLDLLVNAFAALAKEADDLLLLLVGGGKMEGELKAQIKRLGLEKLILMPGRVAHDRIPGVYGLVDVLVYPRSSIRLTELVTPLKPLEAMVMGRPLVASDVGGHRELIKHGETGLLFQAGSMSSLCHELNRVLRDVGLSRVLAAQGQAWVKQDRSWDRTTSGYETLYAEALAG